MYKSLISLSLILVTQIGYAAVWELNTNKSSLNFESTKNTTITEENKFKQFTGTIDDKNATAKFDVSLNSVDTRIPVRDERIRELLFETARYPIASFTTQFDTKYISELSDNKPHTIPVDGTLNLHGVEHKITSQVIAQQLDANTLQIKNAEPIVLNTDDYNLGAGVAALTKIAGLQSIDSSVPVSFTLIFDKK
ncbi:MAG: YceI family protein [Gammaproteobacteria bacterium]